MTFFISNVKEMGISHVVAVKLYQRFKLWRVQAEKMVTEDLSAAAATADVVINTTQVNNNPDIIVSSDNSTFYNGWKNNNINVVVPMTVNSNMTISTSGITNSSEISPYDIGLQFETNM